MRLISTWLVFSCMIQRSVSGATPGPMVEVKPARVSTGQTALVIVKSAEKLPPDISVKAGGLTLPLFACPRSSEKQKCAFLPVSVDAKPETWDVIASWKEGDTTKSKAAKVVVRVKKYPVTTLHVDPDKAEPPADALPRIAAEKKEVEAAWAAASSETLWSERMQPPLKMEVTSVFGNRRRFNGVVKSIHFGVDLKASTGTEIRGILSGKVAMAKEMYFAGNYVLLDHGGGVFSNYAHLSALKVTPGQAIRAGELLGLSGATGRVTGPHLHWGVRIHGVSVDPVQLKELFSSVPF